jgi:hypothetical protein
VVPIVRTSFEPFNATTRPPWSAVTAAGLFSVSPGEGFDRQYHDCQEYWLIFAGRARVRTEDQVYDVAPGDIVCTRAGDVHDVLAVSGELRPLFSGDALPPGGRPGHLHHSADYAAGHLVTGLEESGPMLAGEHGRD